jgi:hypothetical protein
MMVLIGQCDKCKIIFYVRDLGILGTLKEVGRVTEGICPRCGQIKSFADEELTEVFFPDWQRFLKKQEEHGTPHL